MNHQNIEIPRDAGRHPAAARYHGPEIEPPDPETEAVLNRYRSHQRAFIDIADMMAETNRTFYKSVAAAASLATNLDAPVEIALIELGRKICEPEPLSDIPVRAEPEMLAVEPQYCLCLLSPRDWAKDLLDSILSTPPQGIPLPEITKVSPMVKLSSYLSALLKVKDDKEEAKSALHRAMRMSYEDIEEDLNTISKSNRDIIFNYQGYPFLFQLEVFLRDIINDNVCEPCKKDKGISNYIDDATLNNWRDKKSWEENNPLIDSNYRLVDYSDFTDLKKIFERKVLKKKFSRKINQAQLVGVTTKLHELDPIRKKIAHSRLLTRTDFQRLELYCCDVLEVFDW